MSNPVKTTSGGPVAKKPQAPKDPNDVSTPHGLTKQANPTFSSSGASASSGNVKVVCRVRPMNKKELEMGTGICVDFLDDQTIRVNTSQSAEAGAGAHKFVFDKVFNPSVTQQDIYEFAAKPVVNSVLEGFNGTVFAYGQTSSGKTHTMQGPSIDDANMRGIIPRMVNTVFDHIGETPEHIEFTVKVSIVEIYLEKIRDLLSPEKSNLKVREDKARGIYLEDVTESYVSDENEVYDIMKLGASNRAISATNMNEGSSRSHSIFMMTIHQNNLHELSAKTGKLYLVDLAGSEKVGKTGAAGQTLEEAKNINKSLSALGNVINALTDNKSHQHIPYRDSKLTRILQESLGGNARTTLIITCSPSPFNDQETLSTLRFGYRAKSIKNTPKINREFTVAELKLLLDKAESTLEQRERRIKILENLLSNNGIAIPKDDQLNAIQMKAPEKVATPPESTEETEAVSESDSEEKNEGNFSSKDIDNLELMTRNDEQARVKLLESDLEMERNNVKTQTEKVNILRKEYANLSTKLSTSEKENEAIITKLAGLTITIQELEQKFKERDLEHEDLSNLREALNSENEELRRTNQELIQRLEAKGEKVEIKDQVPVKEPPKVDVDDLRDQMVRDLSAKFNINDEEALKAFASSYFDKFKGTMATTDKISPAPISNENNTSEELAREKEKNLKLQTDYQTLQFEYNRLLSEKAQKPEEVKVNEEKPEKKVSGLKDLEARANKASKPEEPTAEEKDLKRKQAEEALRKQNLETLTNMYQQIAAQKAQPKTENPDSDKKVHRKTERILNLEKQLHETKELVNQYKSKIESLKSLISTSNSSTATTTSQLLPDSGASLQLKKEAIKQELRDSMIIDPKGEKNWANTSISKIVKPIRGGQNKKSIGNTKVFLNVLKQSNVPQSSSGNEERKDDYNKYNKIEEEEEGGYPGEK